MTIRFLRKTTGTGTPVSLPYGQPSIDTDGNVYIGDPSGIPVQVAQRGSFLVVSDDTARDAIPTGFRREGMVVSVDSSAGNAGNPTLYRLEGGLLNTDWQIVTTGGSGNLILPSGWTASVYGVPDNITPTTSFLRINDGTYYYEVELSQYVIPLPPSQDYTLDFETGW
jgi:hypothetical protein